MSGKNGIVKNRSELIFLYDVSDANPNGDPMDEDNPRMDEGDEKNIVTYLRLKRTIRDYLDQLENLNIFVKQELTEEGLQKSREQRIRDLNIESEGKQKLFNEFIDHRLFGCTIPYSTKDSSGKKKKGESIKKIGPVQFDHGKSLHKTEPQIIKGTSVFPSDEGKQVGTMIDTKIVPYSLIKFHGIVNENNAKNTGLTEKDVEYLLDGMWNGTKNLITTSKFGHMPRVILRVIYKENNYHHGDLHRKINLVSGKDEKTLRDITELKIDVSDLIESLKRIYNKVEKIQYEVNEDVGFQVYGEEIKGTEIEEKVKEYTKIPLEKVNMEAK